jgi:hypothetical protein
MVTRGTDTTHKLNFQPKHANKVPTSFFFVFSSRGYLLILGYPAFPAARQVFGTTKRSARQFTRHPGVAQNITRFGQMYTELV